MTVAHVDHLDRIPVTKLIHQSQAVLGLVESGQRIEVTRHGKVVAIISPPDPHETTLDELAAAGHVPADWRERQAILKRTLHTLPIRSQPAGPHRIGRYFC